MPDLLRIYYVIDYFAGTSKGGTERQLFELIRGMVQAGHDVTLLVFQHTEYTKEIKNFPCPIECLNIRSILSINTLRITLAFRKRLKAESVDVVHCFFNDASIVIPIVCKSVHVSVFTSRRDMGYWYNRILLLLLGLSNFRTDAIICNSRAVAENVASREFQARRKAVVIYNAVVNSITRSNSQEPTHQIPQGNAIRVCLVASIKPIKRIEDIVQAAERIDSAGFAVEFLIVGSAPENTYVTEIRSKIVAADLKKSKIRLVGEVSDVFPIISSCSIGVLTSESEGLSNAIIEYMSAGLPVVCSDVGGNPELVKHNVNGFLYPMADVESLTRYILTLIQDADLRKSMSKASSSAAQHFTRQVMTQKHETLYLSKHDARS